MKSENNQDQFDATEPEQDFAPANEQIEDIQSVQSNDSESMPSDEAVEVVVDATETPERAEDAAEGAATVESMDEPALKIESVAQAKAIVEALLFSAGDPVSLKRLAKAMGGMNVNDVRGIVTQLIEDYEQTQRGLQVVEMAGGFQLSTRPEYAEWILELTGQKRRSPLTSAALETLAIIAYKQPITRAEIDAIRGVESGGVVRTLLDLELIEVKGRKEVLGKPQLYGTNEKFLRAFGLKHLEELPSIQDLRERYQIGQRP